MGQAKRRKALMGKSYGQGPNPSRCPSLHQLSIPLSGKATRNHPLYANIPTQCLDIFYSDVYATSHPLNSVVCGAFADIPPGCSFLKIVMLGDNFNVWGFAFVSENFSMIRSVVKGTPPPAVMAFLGSKEFTDLGTVLTVILEEFGQVQH